MRFHHSSGTLQKTKHQQRNSTSVNLQNPKNVENYYFQHTYKFLLLIEMQFYFESYGKAL